MKTYEIFFQGMVTASDKVMAANMAEAMMLTVTRFSDKEYLKAKMPGWTGEMGTRLTIKCEDEESFIDLNEFI